MSPAFVFDQDDEATFVPNGIAAGPFAGIQGGAVAALMAIVVERKADPELVPLSLRADFLRPTPLEPLTVEIACVHEGRRVSVYDAAVRTASRTTCRGTVTLARTTPVPVETPGDLPAGTPSASATAYPLPAWPAPWLFDVLDAVRDPDGTTWFRWRLPLAPTATPFSHVLPPADFAHGVSRPGFPDPPRAKFPNPNLAVDVHRAFGGGWLGVRAQTRWEAAGVGTGGGVLIDSAGDLGRVSMGIVLVP